MPRAPLFVTVVFAVSGVSWAARLGVSPDPLSDGSAALVAFSILAGTVVAAAGILLSHGRWSRRLALATVGAEAVVAAVLPLGVWSWVGVALIAAALVGLTGPWLDGWVRRRPAAGGPGLRPMVVALGGVILPGVAGAAAPSGPGVGHWMLAGIAVVVGWGFGKATVWGLWGTRIGLPLVGVWATLASPPAGAVLVLVAVGVVTAAAWTDEARLAVYPLFDSLPGPRRSSPGGAGAS